MEDDRARDRLPLCAEAHNKYRRLMECPTNIVGDFDTLCHMTVTTELTTRVLIADDHEVVREGLRKVLKCQPGWAVVAEAANGKEAISKAIETKPDVAVLDYSMPHVNGIEATRQIRARLPRTEVLIFTVYDDEQIIQECLGAGARGYLLKSDLKGKLLSAIEALGAHKPFFTAMVTERLLASFLTQPTERAPVLNQQERNIVQLIAQGYTNRQIANVLNISSRTVEAQRAKLNRKLDTIKPAGIVRYAIRNGLIEP
jgi:DNA-binding NarL/FixJ family response regulator